MSAVPGLLEDALGCSGILWDTRGCQLRDRVCCDCDCNCDSLQAGGEQAESWRRAGGEQEQIFWGALKAHLMRQRVQFIECQSSMDEGGREQEEGGSRSSSLECSNGNVLLV